MNQNLDFVQRHVDTKDFEDFEALFISVAESMVTFCPITQVGWASRRSGVIAAKVSPALTGRGRRTR